MTELEIGVLDENEHTVVALNGEIDIHSAPRMREKLVELISQGRCRIVLDLRAVDFLDSSGLGVIVGALQRVRSAGGDLTVAGAPPQIHRVIEMSGLAGVFSMFDDVDSATTDTD